MDSKPTARIEFSDANAVDDIDLDDEVTLMVKGKVKALRGPERSRMGKKETFEMPGCMELENCKFKVVEAGEWSKATEAMEED